MGLYLNLDNQGFKEALDSEIYVDKSLLIQHTNSVIKTKNKYICVSRPRRFGKSTTADMLVAYYSKGCDSKDLFASLKISGTDTFENHLNAYNVIHINMAEFSQRADNVGAELKQITDRVIYDIKQEYPDVKYYDDTDLIDVLKTVYSVKKCPFIFVIDEWDCIFREHAGNTDAQKYYLDFLRGLLKDQTYVALAYMTGILPIKKYGAHSALNMFTEVSMLDAGKYADFTGFTEEEVMALCDKYGMSFDETKKWYDGYEVNGISVYNPKSVVSSMESGRFGNYWTSTETYEALKIYIEMNFDGLKDRVSDMIAGGKVTINPDTFQNDMTTFFNADDVLTLLIHLGYLTYDIASSECYIPNGEVAKEFINCITNSDWAPVMSAINASEKLLEYTLNKNEEKVAEEIERVHEEATSIINYNDENSLSMVISLAYYTARNTYFMQREAPAGKGFADIVFLPRHNNPNPPIIVELKFDKDAVGAVEQIRERKYTNIVKKLSDYKGEVICVGINYDKSAKKHTCCIDTVTV